MDSASPIAPFAGLPRRAVSSAGSALGAMIGGVAGRRAGRLASIVPTMAWRYGRRDVRADELLRCVQAERDASGAAARGAIDVAVLVHGLLIDESNWTLGTDRLLDHLPGRFGWQPLMVRYNTGLHISENGDALASLLEQLHDAWGPRLGRVQLIAHSMGGLVSRSALGALERRDASVLDRVERLFMLGSPNQGAELERLGHAVEVAISMAHKIPVGGVALWNGPTPEESGRIVSDAIRELRHKAAAELADGAATPLRSIGRLVRGRSDGIRDLRHAYLQEREWRLAEQLGDRLFVSTRRPLPAPPGVRIYAVAGSLWPTRSEEPSRWRNDGVVSVASVANKGGDFDELELVERGRFVEIPRMLHHLLANSSRVTDQLERWVVEGA